MRIGVPKEIKNNENRVALTPAGVAEFVRNQHTVAVEYNAGLESGFTNEQYAEAGAQILPTAEEIWSQADLIMKVKEPIEQEYGFFRDGLVLFTYLHLAADAKLTRALIDSGVVAIAYETVQANGILPLLTPMSEVAGRMAVQIGAQLLERPKGGKGILLSGITGVPRGKVTIIGGGVVGTNAAGIAIGLGANVTILDTNVNRLRQLEEIFGRNIQTLVSTPGNIAHAVTEADLLVCAVLIPGAKAPTLVTEAMVKAMKPGSVIVDVAIDQGGIVETIDRITTHDAPTYVKHGVVHYAVANMPGAVPHTSTIGLTNVTLPYALQLAKNPLEAIKSNAAIASGVNVMNGVVTCAAVANSLGYPCIPVVEALLQLKIKA